MISKNNTNSEDTINEIGLNLIIDSLGEGSLYQIFNIKSNDHKSPETSIGKKGNKNEIQKKILII